MRDLDSSHGQCLRQTLVPFGVDGAQIPRHNVLSGHYVVQRQVTQLDEVGRLPLRFLGGHLAAKVGGHEVSLGLVREHGCRLEGWDSAVVSPMITIGYWLVST